MIEIKIRDTENSQHHYRYEATLNDYDYQSIMNGFGDRCNDYYATYGRTPEIARKKLIKEIKNLNKIVKKFVKDVEVLI